MKYCRKFQSSE